MDRWTNMDAFTQVVETGSFTAAARVRGCTRAAISKYIAGLEAHLGVTLLHRTTRVLSLTDAGQAYYARCRDLLDELAALEAHVRDEHTNPRGILRITAPPGFMARYGEAITTAFVARYPEIRLDINLSHRMLDLVEEGIDVAIRITAPDDSALIARRLAPAPLVAVASPAYLERHGTPRVPNDLNQHACLIDTNFREHGRWRFCVEGREEIVKVDGPFRVNSPTAIRELALAGQGVALIPAFLVHDDLLAGRLVEVLAGMPDLGWAIFAIYPRRHPPGRVRVFIEHVASVLQADAPLSA